jgi:cyclic pyranopterin phosphate synthase
MLTQYAEPLARIGLSSINISLDTLDAEKFSDMTHGAELSPVLDGIDALISLVSRAKTSVKINAVLLRGFNDNDVIGRLADFAFNKDILLRFIEFMPLHSNLWSAEMFMPFSEALERLPGGADRWVEDQTGENTPNTPAGPARYYVNAITGQRIGVISAVSQHFCGTCNRLRITSAGNIRPCLFDSGQISIAEALRARDKIKVREFLSEAVAKKPKSGVTRREKTCMHTIGG